VVLCPSQQLGPIQRNWLGLNGRSCPVERRCYRNGTLHIVKNEWVWVAAGKGSKAKCRPWLHKRYRGSGALLQARPREEEKKEKKVSSQRSRDGKERKDKPNKARNTNGARQRARGVRLGQATKAQSVRLLARSLKEAPIVEGQARARLGFRLGSRLCPVVW
jgi:hypothetical protein